MFAHVLFFYTTQSILKEPLLSNLLIALYVCKSRAYQSSLTALQRQNSGVITYHEHIRMLNNLPYSDCPIPEVSLK